MCLWCVFPGTCLGVDVDDGGVEDEQPSPPPLRGELGEQGALPPLAMLRVLAEPVGEIGEGFPHLEIGAVAVTIIFAQKPSPIRVIPGASLTWIDEAERDTPDARAASALDWTLVCTP